MLITVLWTYEKMITFEESFNKQRDMVLIPVGMV